MKNFKKLLTAFSFLAVLFFVSCEVEPVDQSLINNANSINNGGIVNTSQYYVKAKVNGVQKVWSNNNGQVQVQFVNNMLLILGSTLSAEGINIGINNGDPISVGTYVLDWAQHTCNYSESLNFYSSDYDNFTTSPGEIKILEINTVNHTIKGTFNFVGKNTAMTVSKQVTEGEFFVNYN